MKWRIYRLPGSQKIWHIDSGVGTPVINVRKWFIAPQVAADAEIGSVDNPNSHPRAWIEISGHVSIFVVGNVARIEYDKETEA